MIRILVAGLSRLACYLSIAVEGPTVDARVACSGRDTALFSGFGARPARDCSGRLGRRVEFVQGGDLGFHGRALGEQQLADLVEVPVVGRDRLGEIEQRQRQPPIIPWRHQFWMIASEDSTPGRLNP